MSATCPYVGSTELTELPDAGNVAVAVTGP